MTAHPSITKALNNEEDAAAPIEEICTDSEIGSAGLRAFCAALLGKGAGMKPTGYKHLKSLRLWKAGCGDAGAAAVVSDRAVGKERSAHRQESFAVTFAWPSSSFSLQAEVLRNGKEEVPIVQVEFMDCGLGPEGCASLGNALMLGANSSLETLRLDLNPGIGDEGVSQLCRGLRTNRTLKRLTLGYCNISPEGAAALAAVLASPLCALERIDLMGNALGSEGLFIMARAATTSKTLVELNLRDNGIGSGTLIAHVASRDAAQAAAAAASGKAAGGAGAEGGDGAAAGAGDSAAASSSAAGPKPGSSSSSSSSSSAAAGAGASSSAGGAGGAAGGTGGGAFSSMSGGFSKGLDAALAEAASKAVEATKTALEELGRVLAEPAVPLHSVDLEMNGLTAEEASALVPYMKDNTKVQMLKVDTSLPSEIFAVLCRSKVASKGKKGKKGGGKKKKK